MGNLDSILKELREERDRLERAIAALTSDLEVFWESFWQRTSQDW
jgi:hypothetical protein